PTTFSSSPVICLSSATRVLIASTWAATLVMPPVITVTAVLPLEDGTLNSALEPFNRSLVSGSMGNLRLLLWPAGVRSEPLGRRRPSHVALAFPLPRRRQDVGRLFDGVVDFAQHQRMAVASRVIMQPPVQAGSVPRAAWRPRGSFFGPRRQ